MNFDDSFKLLIGHEGGYVNHAADPGGETKFGISKRAYPQEDIKHLTLDRAKALYLRDYWGPAGCDALPQDVRYDVFDMAVNSGVRAAIKLLQKTVGTVEDGILGPRTLAAVNSMPVSRLRARYLGSRLEFMASLPTWPAFGRGWARRIAAGLSAV
jgi:lysozyme family protein